MREKAVVIGGGAAGMFASVQLARRDMDVTVLEQNEKLGKKIFITGKGRCNFTNACSRETFFNSVVRNPKFLYSAWNGFSSADTLDFFENAGMPYKIERGSRAFPVSDHAYDVTDALKREMKRFGVKTVLHARVTDILISNKGANPGISDENPGISDENPENSEKNPEKNENTAKSKGQSSSVTGVEYEISDGKRQPERKILPADRVVLATGGLSYPTTGSTGDGFRMAKRLGHSVTDGRPSLVPLLTDPAYPELAGLSLKNVSLSLSDGPRKIYSGFGEMLFTHKGISGPLVLTASSILADFFSEDNKDAEFHGEIDLKPAVSGEEFEERLLRIFTENPNRNLANALRGVYPAGIIEPILCAAGIGPERKANTVSRKERADLVRASKHFPLRITGTAGFSEAVITRGGISVREINPKTMESKIVRGLYFAGELIDTDALTGGFNLQIAWSTAFAAGNA